MSRSLRVMLIFSFLFCCVYASATYLFKDPADTTTIIVQANDTLWDIAERQMPGEDVRKVVKEIKQLNDLSDSTIYRGQELIVPELGSKMVGLNTGKETAAE